MHKLGFDHEQCRVDRNGWIKIVVSNILEGKRSQFAIKNRTIYTIGDQKYDYGSIMHYPARYNKLKQKRVIQCGFLQEWLCNRIL